MGSATGGWTAVYQAGALLYYALSGRPLPHPLSRYEGDGETERTLDGLPLEAAQRAQTPLFFFSGYTNGCTGYLPTAAEWAKGGYETHYSYLIFYRFHGHVMPFEPGAARQLTDTAVAGWRALSSGR